MPLNVTESRARQDRIRRGGEQRVTQPKRPAVPMPGQHRRIVVIRSVSNTTGKLSVQEIAYATDPPQIGEYKAIGGAFDAWPLETAVVTDYALFVWPDDLPLSTQVVPVAVVLRRGVWIAEMIFKAAASLLPPDEPVSGCNFG